MKKLSCCFILSAHPCFLCSSVALGRAAPEPRATSKRRFCIPMEVLAALLLGGIFAFNSLATPNRVAKGAEKALRRQFPGATVQVQVSGKRGKDVLNGRFKNIRISLANLSFEALPLNSAPPQSLVEKKAPKVGQVEHLELDLQKLQFGQLPVERLRVAFDNVRYDFGALKNRSQLRLLSFTNGRVLLGIRGQSLGSLFALRAPEVSNPSVDVQNGEIILRGQRDVLGTLTPVEVRGPVVARGQNIEIGQARVLVNNAALPPAVAAPIVRGINPLFRFDPEGKGPFLLQVNSIQSQNGVIEVQGALTLR